MDLPFDRVARALTPDARVTVLTGAGVSAASGVPTFRGTDGLWKHVRVDDLATPEAFARDPALVWEWYAWRREVVAGCEPHAGHRALAALERAGRLAAVVTQSNTIYPTKDLLGPAQTDGLYWLTPAILCVIAVLAITAPPPRREVRGGD